MFQTKQKAVSCPKSQQGFTLVELLISVFILILAITGIVLGYMRCLELNEIARNNMIAIQAAHNRMEQVTATPFTQIKANFHNVSFAVAELNGRGVSYVNDNIPVLLQVNVSVAWQQKNGRIFGEDVNLNGLIDAGEDKNANGMLDSPVQLTDAILQR